MLEQFTYQKSGVNENVLQLPESSDLSGAGDMSIVRGLSGYGDFYTVRDNRKRAKKEPGELVANKNLVFTKGQSDIINYNHLISSNNPDYKLVNIERKTNFSENKNEWVFKVGFFECEKKTNENITTGNDYYQKGQDGKAYKGFKRYYAVLADESDLINLQKRYNDNSGIYYKAYITVKLYNDLKNKAFGLFLDSLKRNITYYEDELRKEKERFNNPTYGTNIESKKKWLARAEENLKNAKKVLAYNYAFYGIKNDSEGLGKPTIKFEFENNDELKNFLKENKENLIDSYIDVDVEPESKDVVLNGYGDFYEVRDERKRSRKEPGDLLNNKNLSFKKISEKSIVNFDKDLYSTSEYSENHNKIANGIEYYTISFKIDKDNNLSSPISFLSPSIFNRAEKKFRCSWVTESVEVDKRKLKNINFKDSYAYCPADYYATLINAAIVKYLNGLVYVSNNTNYLAAARDNAKKKIKYFIELYSQPEIYRIFLMHTYGDDSDLTNEKLTDYFKFVDKSIFSNFKGLAGVDSRRNPDDYNYKVLCTKGFSPTYQFLDDYSPLIAESDNKITATGKGFKDTIETLKNAVFEGKKQVEKLAEHLKDPAGSIYQSCFNVWHWLQTNVKYNFDRQGKEDIRLPARTWLDRERGVDCDCLSVFAFCLLANMGLKPVFEIVAFFGRDDYSHIYVNCEGVIVDRVLNKFNERAPFITKIKKMEVPVYQLSGISGGFDGLNDTVLKNIRNQNPLSHNCSIRKNIAYERMRGNPVEQRAFAMFLPYMADVDLHNGALYFYRPEFAKVATWADSLLMNYYKNASQNTDLQGIELGKLFKKIGKALKKAAKKVAKATKKVVKATGNAVKSVAKATANTVKAAAKSTVNAVKATANLTKAAAQLATGNAKKAKETLKKAGSQAKSAVVNPIKQAAKDTKNVTKTAIDTTKTVVKETVINPTKTAVKMVGKLVKVLLIKINPVTVLMRNSLRGLIALNFLGLASKLAVGQMTEANALAAGYDKDMYDKAVKAYNRVKKFFKSLGGDVSKLEKTIEKGAKRKALFKKDNNYNINTPVNESDLQGLGALGEPVTIGTMLAAVGSFFAKIWGWIKNIAPKVAQALKNSGVGERLKEAGLRKLDEKLGNKTNSENDSEGIIDDGTTNNTTTDNKKNWLLPALVIAGVGAAVALSGNKKK